MLRRVLPGQAGFPSRLCELPHAPRVLWYAGRLPAPAEQLVAVVGARAATAAGCDRAAQIAGGLAGAGVAVVSGGAFGIDAAAHAGALAGGSATFAVLGCGADVVYPDRHAKLFARIAAAGGLLAEYPPGTPPRRGQFPARNRIIAALAEAVVIVEAAFRSGALITAQLARDLGRPLFAVPGSPGTDVLLRAGRAMPATCSDDILGFLVGGVPPVTVGPDDGGAGVPERFATVVEAIRLGFHSPSDLCKYVGMALPSLLAVLAEAELEGYVKRAAGNSYEVIAREH